MTKGRRPGPTCRRSAQPGRPALRAAAIQTCLDALARPLAVPRAQALLAAAPLARAVQEV